MKFKLLKEMPDIKAGKTGKVIHRNGLFEDSVEFESDYGLESTHFNLSFVEEKTEWFATYLFTTEDKVDIYTGDEYFTVFEQGFYEEEVKIEPNTVYGGFKAWHDENGFVDYVKLFSTKQAAEDYLKPKFKVGDIVYYKCGFTEELLKVKKVDNLCLVDENDRVNPIKYCNKATNEQTLKYYQDLGWVKGAKFKAPKPYPFTGIFNNIVFRNNFIGLWLTDESKKELGCDDFKLWNIEECELIKYPESWKDLKEIEGYYLSQYSSNLHFSHSTSLGTYKKVVFNTEKQALSCLAYAQLSQLIAEINQNWQPNWCDLDSYKFVIVRSENRQGSYLTKQEYTTTFHPLAFKTAEARDFSFEFHKDLWKTYYQL